MVGAGDQLETPLLPLTTTRSEHQSAAIADKDVRVKLD
jgi:hypothetical protein